MTLHWPDEDLSLLGEAGLEADRDLDIVEELYLLEECGLQGERKLAVNGNISGKWEREAVNGNVSGSWER